MLLAVFPLTQNQVRTVPAFCGRPGWVQTSRMPLMSPDGGCSRRLRSRLLYLAMSWAIHSHFWSVTEDFALCSIRLPRVIIPEITLLNNPEICLFLFSLLSSEVAPSPKPCCVPLGAVSVTGRAWGWVQKVWFVCSPGSRGIQILFMLYFILFYFFHVKAIQQFISWSRRQSFAAILLMYTCWSAEVLKLQVSAPAFNQWPVIDSAIHMLQVGMKQFLHCIQFLGHL